jgi:predicted lipid-binding transport protein (Tim44 family)
MIKRWGIIPVGVALLAASAWGRAGGGEGFHGGGGGGFGGGGFGGGGFSFHDGGGGGNGLFWMIEAARHPLLALIVILIIAMFAIYWFSQQVQATEDELRAGGRPPVDADRFAFNRSSVDNDIQTLRSADPAFDEQAFYARLKTAFLKIQAAWSAQDLTTVRSFVSDGIHERFGLQFMEQKDEGIRNLMKDVSISRVRLMQVRTEGGFTVATVRIDARAVDCDLSLANGAVVRGSGSSEPFDEYWTFLRRQGSQSISGRGLIEGHCPNCGAAIEINAGAKCASCRALLRSGQYDWVLAEITQEGEWVAARQEQISGVSTLRQLDPEFSMADLEDRASVMFWRRLMAERLGRVDPLRKIAAQALVQSYQELLRPRPDHQRRYFGDCAVGSVQTLGVLPLAHGESLRRALVRVHWEGQSMAVKADGRIAKIGDRTQRQSLFVLGRGPDVLTNPGNGLSSAHCPHCGAPATVDTANACEFCGTVLNDGSQGWILMEAVPTSSEEARSLFASLGNP